MAPEKQPVNFIGNGFNSFNITPEEQKVIEETMKTYT